jgi:Dolichyl-phosphate-mannose-protein mannosyltransferase
MPPLASTSALETPTAARIRSSWRIFLAVAVLLLLAGTALRLYHLGVRSLWFDEAVTANTSSGTLTQMLGETRARLTSAIVYPCILFLIEKVARTAEAVRAPSMLASILTIVVMLAMVRAKVNRNAVLFAAAILAISASQIRYAQEVREYSLSALWGACMIYCFLRWEVAASRDRHPVALYTVLFFAPLIQYGLVLLACGVLVTMVLRLLLTRDTPFKAIHAVAGSACLAAGAALSYFLTLRDQYRPGGRGHWYLAAEYFDPRTMNLFHFLSTNSINLLRFLIPGHLFDLLVVFAAVAFCIVQVIHRQYYSITLLVFSSLLITMAASIANVYPYGGVRQCLFLAPAVALFVGVAFADLTQRLNVSVRPIASVALLAVIAVCLYRETIREWPYGEYEDTKSVLRTLQTEIGPNDEVWVNHDAAEAIEFYMQGRDQRFVYGEYLGEEPQGYAPELLGSIDSHRKRVWLIFSHLQQASDRAQDEFIVSSLRSGWDVHRVIAPMNAELYVANRKGQ